MEARVVRGLRNDDRSLKDDDFLLNNDGKNMLISQLGALGRRIFRIPKLRWLVDP